MRGLIAGLLAGAGNAMAHPGHGAPQGHLHWVGPEHVVLLVVIVGCLLYAVRR